MSGNGRNGNGRPTRSKGNGGVSPDSKLFPSISDAKKRAFLVALAATGNALRAAEASGVTDRSHRNWKSWDPDYAAAAEEAMDMATDLLEDEAQRRAVAGLKRFKFHQGEPIIDPDTGEPYYELEYSDTLLIFLLKGAKPEKYRERYDHQHGGSIGFTLVDALKELEEPASDSRF